MTLEGSIMKIVPGLQATALLGQNLKLAQDSLDFKRHRNMKNMSGKFIKTAVTNFVGVGLIGPTSKMINAL